MLRARRHSVIAAVLAVAVIGLFAGGAAAVSSGGYQPSEQDCSIWADSNVGGVEPGCHNLKVNVEDSSGNRYVQAGTFQTNEGQNVHSGDVKITPNGSNP